MTDLIPSRSNASRSRAAGGGSSSNPAKTTGCRALTMQSTVQGNAGDSSGPGTSASVGRDH